VPPGWSATRPGVRARVGAVSWTPPDLTGKVAIVTGASRGIGKCVALALARQGADVVVAARSVETRERLPGTIHDTVAAIEALGRRALAVRTDVRDAAAVEAMVQRAADELGRVDVLVNNAGVAASAPLKSVEPEDWERIFAVNVRGTYLCTREFLPDMLAAGWGRVINVASIAGLSGAAYISAYAASKHAVIGFTRSLAAEVAAEGVTVNAVCPGYVDTPMTDGSVAHIAAKTGLSADDARERLKRMSPQRRLFEPEEVAYLALCLADPRAKGVNGQAIVLDGGALLA